MEYLIQAGGLSNINFSPATVVEEILQNIKCILNTTKFSVPLDRDFGIDASFIDMPMDVAKAQFVSEVILAVARYEPRAAVTNIDWEHDIDGILRPKVQVRIDET